MTDAWTEPRPSNECSRSASDPSSAPIAVRTGPAFTIASRPRCGRDPCAARPTISISLQTTPLSATAMLLEDPGLEATRGCPCHDRRGGSPFARTVGHERRVDRVGGDEVGEELLKVRHALPPRFLG